MKLMKDNKCWKCKSEIRTCLHCIWDCKLVKPFWVKVVDLLSSQTNVIVPLTPVVFLLGDRTQITNVPKIMLFVIVTGLMNASRMILKCWTSRLPQKLKEQTDAMVETSSYESMLHRLEDRRQEGQEKETPCDMVWTTKG